MSSKSRVIRVFLSSTFKDFAEERDLLVKKVFPELRRLCRQRQVELVDVDLRWGITVEEAEQGKVLPICLEEINRARPYFMGFIGDRYGWVPNESEYQEVVIEREPWLEEHRGGKSVTELEMLHGVLNNPDMAGRAYFYFRDSKYSKAKGGDYAAESPEHTVKLEKLKERLRASDFPVVENYPDPEALAEQVREDLRALIEEEYPEEEVPDALTLERMRHEAYGAARRPPLRLYLGGDKYFRALDEAIAKEADEFRPVMITGESGSGKTALIANWISDFIEKHPRTQVIVHHLNASSDAVDPVFMIRRLAEEIMAFTGDDLELKRDPEDLLNQLPEILALAGTNFDRGHKSWLVILEGLNMVSDQYDLKWFPRRLPNGVKLIVTCNDGDIEDKLKGLHNWETLQILPLSTKEGDEFIDTYLGNFRKTLNEDLKIQVLNHPLACNPLWLITILEELRLFGVHEEVEARLNTLLSNPPSKEAGEEPTIDDLYEHVLARIEKDIEEDYEVEALKAIWASRDGLTRSELLDLTGMPPVKWAEIQASLDENLFESRGLISPGTKYFRKALQDYFALFGECEKITRCRLVRYFTGNEGLEQARVLLEESFQRVQLAIKWPEEFLQEASEYLFTFERLNQFIECGLATDFIDRVSFLDKFCPEAQQWKRFVTYRLPYLSRQVSSECRQQALCQFAFEDGLLSPISISATRWLLGSTHKAAFAYENAPLNCIPDAFEALYRHPLCPAPRDSTGHTFWITGSTLLTNGNVVSWSRDDQLLIWSASNLFPVDKVMAFESGCDGVIEVDRDSILVWKGKRLFVYSFSKERRLLEWEGNHAIAGAFRAEDSIIYWDTTWTGFEIKADSSEPEELGTGLNLEDTVTEIAMTSQFSSAQYDVISFQKPNGEPRKIKPISFECEGEPEITEEILNSVFVLSAHSILAEQPRKEHVNLSNSNGDNVRWVCRGGVELLKAIPSVDIHIVRTNNQIKFLRTF